MMTRNMTDKEIEREKKKLEDRGGSKKETVYDIMKRQKHKMKLKMVMDQKANSIADLAAVLTEQEELGATTAEAKQKHADEWRTRSLEEMERLAQEADNGSIEKIETQIEELCKTLQELRQHGTEGRRGKLKKQIVVTRQQLQKMRRAAQVAKEVPPASLEIERLAQEVKNGGLETLSNQIAERRGRPKERKNSAEVEEPTAEAEESFEEAEQRHERMQWAAKAVEEAKANPAYIEGAATEAADAADTAEAALAASAVEAASARETASAAEAKAESASEAASAEKAALAKEAAREVAVARDAAVAREAALARDAALARETASAREAASSEQLLPAYKRAKMLWYAEKFDPIKRDPEYLPKRGWVRREAERWNRPVYTSKGITVKWANITDAEYAASWPDAVQHERMGYTTRSPPLVDTETVAEFRALSWKGRRENFQLDETTAEKVERLRAEMGLQARVDKPWKFVEAQEIESGFLPGRDPSDVEAAEVEGEELEAAPEVAEEFVEEEDPERLQKIQEEILGRVRQMASKESWDKRANQDLKKAKNKFKLAPLPVDATVDQQPTV